MMIDFYEISLVKINDNSFNLEKNSKKYCGVYQFANF